ALIVSLLALFAYSGCVGDLHTAGTSWHQKCGWKASDYFDDPKVVALCDAIETNDLPRMSQLVAAGANINSLGRANMTPLLWAFPDNNLPRFKWLLEHGANPNVLIKADFNSHGAMIPGDSVTHLAAATEFPGYFEAVFENGGDVNFESDSAIHRKDTPL